MAENGGNSESKDDADADEQIADQGIELLTSDRGFR